MNINKKIPSRRTIKNDDLSILTDIPKKHGKEAAEALKLSRKIFDKLHRRGPPHKPPEKRKSHTITLRLTPAEFERLQTLVKQKNTSVSKIIRNLIHRTIRVLGGKIKTVEVAGTPATNDGGILAFMPKMDVKRNFTAKTQGRKGNKSISHG